jgi:hypothetical protein
MKNAQIQWPKGAEFAQNAALANQHHSLLTGAFGTIDGLNLPLQVSDSVEIENSTFNGWLHGHFTSSVLVFSFEGM